MTALETFIAKTKNGVCLVLQRDGEGDALLRVLHRDYSEYEVWCGGVQIWQTNDRDSAHKMYGRRKSEYATRMYRWSYAG